MNKKQTIALAFVSTAFVGLGLGWYAAEDSGMTNEQPLPGGTDRFGGVTTRQTQSPPVVWPVPRSTRLYPPVKSPQPHPTTVFSSKSPSPSPSETTMPVPPSPTPERTLLPTLFPSLPPPLEWSPDVEDRIHRD